MPHPVPRRRVPGALLAAAGLLATAAPAMAAYPGSPGKVAYLDNFQADFPLRVFTPDPPHADGGTVQTIRAATFRIEPDGDVEAPTNGLATPPAWSPDGTRLAFAAKVPDPGLAPGAHHTAIFVWTLRTGATQQITFPPAGAPDADPGDGLQTGHAYADFAPTWSPDGTRIAFVRNVVAGEDDAVYPQRGGEVRMVGPAGGATTELDAAAPDQMYVGLVWGGDPADPADGALVGLRATGADESGRNGALDLVRISPATGSAQTLVGSPQAAAILDFDVDPSGRQVAYTTIGGGTSPFQIRRLDLDGMVDAGIAGVLDPRLRSSPTGNGALRIAFAPVAGTRGQQRDGLLERRFPDPDGDLWSEEPRDRFVSRYTGPTGDLGRSTPFRSLWDVQPQRLPVVVIPGFAGSTITCEGQVIWQPGALPFENSTRLQQMRLGDDGASPLGCLGSGPTDDPDAPDALVSTVLGKPIYKPMEDMMERLAPGDRSWRFGWDWRKAPGQSVARLDAFITKILDGDAARAQGLTQVAVYAHSYGSLLTREYVTQHPERIARVLTSGAPYWGAAKPIFPITFGVENPMAGLVELDALLPDADLKAFMRTSAGVHHLLPGDHFGPWLTVGGQPRDQAGVRAFFAGPAGGNPGLVDQARAWHQTHDGFTTAGGQIDWRAVIATGVLTIEGADVAPRAEGDGTLTTIVRLGDGDGTVPARSASQGPVGTHDPLGDPVHVQSICRVLHIPLAGDPRVEAAYGDFLLTGRTPRRTEGACAPHGVGIKVVRLDSTPGTASAPLATLAAGDVLPGGRTVAAGRTVSVGGAFSCTVRPASVTCVSMDTGNGFSISRAGVKTFTPPPGGY